MTQHDIAVALGPFLLAVCVFAVLDVIRIVIEEHIKLKRPRSTHRSYHEHTHND